MCFWEEFKSFKWIYLIIIYLNFFCRKFQAVNIEFIVEGIEWTIEKKFTFWKNCAEMTSEITLAKDLLIY